MTKGAVKTRNNSDVGPNAPRTITAARLHEHGKPLVIESVALPEPGPDEVLVTLELAGVNPIDRYIAEGRVPTGGSLPRTLGGEGVGKVQGESVLVAGGGLGAARDGLWAQAAVVAKQSVIPLPDGVAPRDAAVMGIAGLTAFNVVHELGRVGAEDRVLVLGASGGVGSMIVSLAAAAGATVWGQTGSQRKVGSIEAQGAQHVVVAGPEKLVEALSDLQPTVVFDPLGGAFVAPSIEALALRGRLVSFGTSAGADVSLNMQSLYRKMISVLGYGGLQLESDERRAGLQAALRALKDGSLRVLVDEVLALEQINEALQRLVDRQVQGKLLLALGD
jgi:NADPH2:quinone reductase